jgi:lysophospholipase L1-like esterase
MRLSIYIAVLAMIFTAAFGLKSLPMVFVVGDSISMQYGPYLESYLKGTASYQRKMDNAGVGPELGVPEVNGGDSRMVLEYLKAKTKDPEFKPDYLLLNCGLHDIKREVETKQLQVPENKYQQNLEAIVELLGSRNIQVIWVRTTAVIDSIHNSKSKRFHRFAADLEAYNKIADQVMASNQIPVVDLYTFTWSLGLEQFMDHVHYHDEARKLQAAYIAGHLKSLISGY